MLLTLTFNVWAFYDHFQTRCTCMNVMRVPKLFIASHPSHPINKLFPTAQLPPSFYSIACRYAAYAPAMRSYPCFSPSISYCRLMY